MRNEERLSRLICEIYDSTLDPSLWPQVLGKIAEFVGGQSAGLISRDSVSKAGNAHYTFGCNPHYLKLYLDQYAKLDPTTAMFFFATERVASIVDFMPSDGAASACAIAMSGLRSGKGGAAPVLAVAARGQAQSATRARIRSLIPDDPTAVGLWFPRLDASSPRAPPLRGIHEFRQREHASWASRSASSLASKTARAS